jgi:SAM-dependent methyltransferase
MKDRLFPLIDKLYIDIDRSHIRRTKNIRLIPGYKDRRGGKLSYAEWAHVIGIFQTLIYQTVRNKTGNTIADIGCGTGLLGIASEPFVGEGGKYTGIDVMKEDIEFCRSHYTFPNYEFIYFDVANPTYAAAQSADLKHWPLADGSQDLVTALSVWTHLNERDGVFYFKEIQRILKTGGKAIVTFFLLDEQYEASLSRRSDSTGRYHGTVQNDWIFNISAYDSKNWFTVPTAQHPEDAIGITKEGLNILLASSGLKLVHNYPGNWKEIPGVFFQDVLIFEKI